MQDGRPSVSVIIASRHRTKWLLRCLDALSRVRFTPFEIIVVCDSATHAELRTTRFDGMIKSVMFDKAALAEARNIGVGHAAGDICAFIDDDAVPEPTWLSYLIDPFVSLAADAAVGFVRGRNGISFQSRVSAVDREAETHPHPSQADMPFVFETSERGFLKLVGTNMAIRSDLLRTLGGFDADFDFYLDDSDLSLRAGRAGARMAVAPLAEVHHAFASSDRRTAQRRPRQLFDIGRSTAAFVRKHRAPDLDDIRLRLFRREKARLIGHLVRGTCEPRDVTRLLTQLGAGWNAGLKLPVTKSGEIEDVGAPFLPLAPPEPISTVSSCRLLRRRSRLKDLMIAARQGGSHSLFSFSLTPVRHHVRFQDGVWVQTGGQFGRAARHDVVFRWTTFGKRLRCEVDRVAKPRGIDEIGNVRDTNDEEQSRRATAGMTSGAANNRTLKVVE